MSRTKAAGQTTEVTFERGYRRLQDIAEQVGSEEVPVERMCELFAEGKGLEQALVAYLEEQKERIEAIERGEGVPQFRVVRTTHGEDGAGDGAIAADDRADAADDRASGAGSDAGSGDDPGVTPHAERAAEATQDEIPF